MSFRETWSMRWWAFFKVPMIWLTRASVEQLSDQRCVVRIPFRKRNRNHVGSMYIGVLCVGADVAGGLMAMRRIERSGRNVSLIFKDVKAEFHKRAEGAVHFVCEDGEAIGALVDRTLASGERENATVCVRAMVPDKLGDEPAATFDLTLSLKRRD
jgi:hypothetical protein